jgi:hypothetical protein
MGGEPMRLVLIATLSSLLMLSPAAADDVRTFAVSAAGVTSVTITLMTKAEDGKKAKVMVEDMVRAKPAYDGRNYFMVTIMQYDAVEVGQVCVKVGHGWVVKTGDDYVDDNGRPSRQVCIPVSVGAEGGMTVLKVTTKAE